MNTFEKATKLKLRFATAKGELSIEELWDLSLPSLDLIARAINKQLKEQSEESFIDRSGPSTLTTTLTVKLDVVKEIIAVKQEEATKAKSKAERAAQIALVKQLIDNKRMEKMEGTSLKKLEEQLAELESGE